MAENFPGDEEFRDFMNREYNKNDPIFIIIEALRCKISAVSDVYGKSLDAYTALKAEDPLKKVLGEHIKRMMEQTLLTMDQFNYALINDDSTDDEEKGEVPDDDS